MTKRRDGHRNVPRLALSRPEVALAIGVSVSSVDIMVEEGALPRPRKWHSRKLWLVSDIEAHMNDWAVDGEDNDSPSSFEEWAKERDGTAAVAGGGYPVVTDPKHPLKQYYDRLGFDPVTMNLDDMRRLSAEAHAAWRESMPGSAYNLRERKALAQLLFFGANVPVKPASIKDCGPDTAERLEARGFLKVETEGDRTLSYTLTEAGLAAAKSLAHSL